MEEFVGVFLMVAYCIGLYKFCIYVRDSPKFRAKRVERVIRDAQNALAQGRISDAEHYFKQVLKDRDDVPERLATMYFQRIKQDKLSYVNKALTISIDGLSQDALRRLRCVQYEIRTYIEDQISKALLSKDYLTAIKYNKPLTAFGEHYKKREKAFNIYSELKYYLESGQRSANLLAYLSNDMSIVIECINDRIKALSELDTLKLLALALCDAGIKAQFESRVLKYVLASGILPNFNTSANTLQRTYLEKVADTMSVERTQDAIKIYKALNLRGYEARIQKKLEHSNFQRACVFLGNGETESFISLLRALEHNQNLDFASKKELRQRYLLRLCDYLFSRLLTSSLTELQWDMLGDCFLDSGLRSKYQSEIKRCAIEFYAQNRYAESARLCEYLEITLEVLDLLSNNVVKLLEKSDRYDSLPIVDRWSEPVVRKIADRCFDYVMKLAGNEEYTKAINVERLLHKYIDYDDNRYDFIITLNAKYLDTVSKARTLSEEELISFLSYFRKVRNKSVFEKHIETVKSVVALFLSSSDNENTHMLFKRIDEVSHKLSLLFLEAVESLNFSKACAFLENGDFKEFRCIQESLNQNPDITADTKSEFEKKYNELSYKFLCSKILTSGLTAEEWEIFFEECSFKKKIGETNELLMFAIELSDMNMFEKSARICSIIKLRSLKFIDLVCSNIIRFLDKYGDGEELPKVFIYPNYIMHKVADRCFEWAATFRSEGNHKRALMLENTMASFLSCEAKEKSNYLRACTFIENGDFDAFRSCQEMLMQNESIIAYDKFELQKKYNDQSCKYLSSKLLAKGLTSEEWTIFIQECRFKKSIKETDELLNLAIELNATDRFEESARICHILNLRQKSFIVTVCSNVVKYLANTDMYDTLPDIYIYSPYIMQKVADRCLKYAVAVAGEGDYFKAVGVEMLIEPYMSSDIFYADHYAKGILGIFTSDPQAALNLYARQRNLVKRRKILVEISILDNEAFHSFIVYVLKYDEEQITRKTFNTLTIAKLLKGLNKSSEKVSILKEFLLYGYDVNSLYVKAIDNSVAETTSVKKKLRLVDEALTIASDLELYDIKFAILIGSINISPLKSFLKPEKYRGRRGC